MDQRFVDSRCDKVAFSNWLTFIQQPENSPEAMEAHTGVHADDVRVAARLYATGGNAAIYYGWALPNTVRVQQRSWRSLTWRC